MVSTIGKFLDPLADKATQFTLTVCLAIRYPILWSLVGLFVLKESFQLIAGIIQFRKGKMLIGALISGKVCTTILFISLIVMVMLPNLDANIVNILTIVDALFMLIAFTEYVVAYFCMNDKFQSLDE